jgi:hypothetical protein
MDVGGVYRPLVEMVPVAALPPATPFTCQITAVLVRFVTVAVKCVEAPMRVALAPLTTMLPCVRVVGDVEPAVTPPPCPQPVASRMNAPGRRLMQ